MKKPTIIGIDLVTKLGTFKFKSHFNSTADFIQAMWLFQSNNWEMLGDDVQYIAYTKFPDDIVTKTTFTGMNASANLCAFIES